MHDKNLIKICGIENPNEYSKNQLIFEHGKNWTSPTLIQITERTAGLCREKYKIIRLENCDNRCTNNCHASNNAQNTDSV